APAGVAFTHLSVGVDHSCAESSDGQVYCWGRNEDDRLGDGSGGDRATPAPGGAPAGVELSSPSAGYAHVCTMGSTALYCWGNNTAGQVGNGNRTHRPLPTIVA